MIVTCHRVTVTRIKWKQKEITTYKHKPLEKIFQPENKWCINILPQFQKGERDGEELNCYSK